MIIVAYFNWDVNISIVSEARCEVGRLYRPTCGVICSLVCLLSWLLADSRLAAQTGGSAHRARTTLPNNTRNSPDAVLMLGQRRRRWTIWNRIGWMPRVCWVCIGAYFSYTLQPRRLKREERLLPISKLTPLLADTDMADNATESSLVASRGLMSFLQLPN